MSGGLLFSPYLRHVTVTRYMLPLREGGSLPALAEADDDFKYVLKFRGTGHGEKALIAEYVGGEVARLLGLRVPELVYAGLDEAFGRTEGDEEIQDLLKASQGLNIAMHFLSGAITFDPAAHRAESAECSMIVWMDAFLTNIDRTSRNTNMLMWNKELWLIDHGSCLSFQHNWTDLEKSARSPFAYSREHVLLSTAVELEQADRKCRSLLDAQKLRKLVSGIPDEWLQWRDTDQSPAQLREQYLFYLTERLANSDIFLNEAINARNAPV